MAKKRADELTEAERREQATLEANVAAEEAREGVSPSGAYREAGDPGMPGSGADPRRYKDGTWTTGEPVASDGPRCGKPYTVSRTEAHAESVQTCGLAAGHTGPCGPAAVVEQTPEACWLEDARAAQGVFGAGNPISPDVLKSLVGRAIGLLTPRV